MQGIQMSPIEARAVLATATRFAASFGRVGCSEPDDVAQCAMLRLLSRRDRKPATTGWLYKVVRNITYDEARRSLREARYLSRFDDNQTRLVCEQADDEDNIYSNNHRGSGIDIDSQLELKIRMTKMLDQLTPTLKEPLVLKAQGYSYKQIAHMTQVGIGTIRSRLHNARKRAKELLGSIQ